MKNKGKKIGLVLSGGGARGAYQVGAWKAMRELGLDRKISAVSGTSAGALNGALFCQGSFYKAEKAWLGVTKSRILHLDSKTILKNLLTLLVMLKSIRSRDLLNFVRAISSFGVFSRSGLMEMMEKSLEPKLLRQSGIPLYVCAFNVTKSSPEFIKVNSKPAADIKLYLLASSAIPGIFEPVKVKSCLYLDGGLVPLFRKNVPFEPLVEKEGCETIVVIHLTSKPDTSGRTGYQNIEFIDIWPEKTSFNFGSSLKFSRETAASLIEAGCNDALEKLKNC